MAKSLNKAQLIGNAGKDAEVRYTGTGKPVASFSVATTDSWKDKASGQLQERTEWHNIVAWDRLAEICGEYVKKGTRVYIEGRIQNRSYDDKDGNKRWITEVVAEDVLLLGGRASDVGSGPADDFDAPGPVSMPRSAQPQRPAARPQQESSFDQGITDDDVPF